MKIGNMIGGNIVSSLTLLRECWLVQMVSIHLWDTLGIIILHDDFAFNNPNTDQRLRDLSRRLYSDRSEISTPETFPLVDWDLFCFDSQA